MSKKVIHTYIFLVLALVFSFDLAAQPYTLGITIDNQPDTPVVLGEVEGDNFTPIDSAKAVNNLVKFTFPEDAHPGVYRLIFGQTLYAKIMDEAPQQIDVIFNYENIILETDFEAPEENLWVVLSEENRIWNEFKRREILFREELKIEEKEVDYYQNNGNTEKLASVVESYNRLQNRRDQFITELIEKNPASLASQMIALFREPFMDGYLSAQERKQIFHENFLKNKDFTNKTLINSSVYTDIIFNYLVSYNQKDFNKRQREIAYQNAVDKILAATSQDPEVYEFIMDYLVHGFEVLQMENVITYIARNYSDTVCKSEEKSTLERKLQMRKMIPGTAVPDFILNNVNGEIVIFSDELEEQTLLVFWASWCPHCREMIPYIKNWEQQNSDIKVVAVSLDTDEDEWKNAIAELGIGSWVNLCDFKKWDGEVATDYNIYATPTMFIVNNNREIVATPVTMADLTQINL